MTALRHQRILALLQDQGHVTVRALQSEFSVTTMTIWRDLKMLEEQGLLRRIHGGAQKTGRVPGEPDYEKKAVAASDAKARIAARAVQEFVREGDVIAMEGGTTVAALIDCFPESKISVITNSLPVALRLRAQRPGLSVRMIGGWLSPVSGNTTGPDAVKAIEKLRASVCFIGATGFDSERGPMDPNPLEIEVKRTLSAISSRTVLLMDSGKMGVSSASVTLHPRRMEALVTEARPGEEVMCGLRKMGLKLIVAGTRR
jgi:DeoR family transcriptional regulator, fructose operon transcriptional repressor